MFVELPAVGKTVAPGDEAAVVESVKAASDIYAPVSGKVVAANEELEDAPDLINSDAYGGGWLFAVKLSDPAEVEGLLNAESYSNTLDD